MAGVVAEGSSGVPRVALLLDALRAAELAGVEALGRWLEHCADPALRGALRVVRTRDLAHADLVAERLAALGMQPAAEASRLLGALCAVLGAPDGSDRAKLATLVARLPPDDRDPMAELTAAAGDDVETRALLETIADDDRTSMAWLRAAAAAPPAAPRPFATPRPATVRRLDALRAAEAASAAVFAAWAAVSALPALRGGLRAIAAREAGHAAVLEARLRELGAAPAAAVPAAMQAAALARFGAAGEPDAAKLDALLARHPEPRSAAEPALGLAAVMGADAESREILRLVAAAERATFGWLRARAGTHVGRLAPTGS